MRRIIAKVTMASEHVNAASPGLHFERDSGLLMKRIKIDPPLCLFINPAPRYYRQIARFCERRDGHEYRQDKAQSSPNHFSHL